MGAHARGGDADPAAVTAARNNAATADVTLDLQTWDARNLPLADGSATHVVSNLPWGRQVEVDETLTDFYAKICDEIMRVLAPGGRIVLLTNVPELVTFAPAHITERIEISLFGQQPTILVIQPPT